ncbi:MAG: protein kinase domain-containing protein [Thermoanaerobaculia bacterium]
MTIAAGARLGPYEVLAPLGAGGMGEVYKARDTRLERTVAIKVLPAHLSSSEEMRQRFEREARAISQLSHPHICALYDVGSHEGTEYLVMELLEGETLAARLVKGPLPTEQLLRYGVEMADALDKAHRQGIVHRDLKPGNVMLTKSGVKLLDFGLAKALPSPPGRGQGEGLTSLPTMAGAQNLTQEGTILGTFQYMAPEQLEGKEADARTDIFAFGATLYEMATGRKAFSGTSQASLISAIMQNDPPPISSVHPISPPALDRVVRKCLAKDPEDRWQNAADLGSELKWIADGSQTGVSASTAPRRRSWLPWAIAAIAAFVAVGALLRPRRAEMPAASRMILSILPPQGAAWTDWFALSSDGGRLALVASNEGRMQIWIRRLDEEEARPVAGTEGAENPFWSPDGRSLAFFGQSKLKRIDLESGAVQVLCDAGIGRGGAWGREGVILFAAGSPGGLSRVSASGGAPVTATRFEASRGDLVHRWPHFLPDGNRFLVFVWTGSAATSGIYLGSLESQDLKLLQPSREAGQFLPPDRLLYARGEALVAKRLDLDRAQPSGEPETLVPKVDVAEVGAFLRLFSASQNGVVAFRDAGYQRPLVWFDRRGNVAGRTSAVAGAAGFSLSPDEGLAAYSTGTLSASDVWILDLKRDVPTKFTSGSIANAPLISRDGRFLYYRFFGPKHFEIRRKPVRGSGPEETVFEGNAFETPQDETPDGKTLIVQSTRGSQDIWALALQSDRKLVPLVATEFAERAPRLSPDGRWFAYHSDESGRFEVYVRRFPVTEEKWQVSTRGGIWPYWRGDGKEIYYIGLDGAFMAAPVVMSQTFSVGTPESLFQTRLRLWTVQRQYAASRDGQRFLMIYPTQDPAASPMNVLLNWQAPAERK